MDINQSLNAVYVFFGLLGILIFSFVLLTERR
jgi:hypothetical protein